MTGAEAFVAEAKRQGLDAIFTLVGDHLNEVLAVAEREGLRIVDMRHESGVTHAADAWARIHRKPALALVTGGPGHTNALTGIATAQLASSPLIAVSGSRSSKLGARGAFQDIDQVGMARPVTKWSAEVADASQIPFYLRRACEIANAGRRGAVHLTIPVDVFQATATPAAARESVPVTAAKPDVSAAIQLLRTAERPILIAGSGVWWADAGPELREFVERTSLPLYTITMAKGCVPDDHPGVMGYADPALNTAVRTAFREADVVLVIGKRIDYRLALGGPRLFAPEAKFIQIDVEPTELGLNRPLACAIQADVKSALRALIDTAGAGAWVRIAWFDRLAELRESHNRWLAEAQSDTALPIRPAAFYRELLRALPRETLYAWDGGDFAHWGRVSIPALHAGGWLRLGPLGTIGSALPNGIALQLAHPNRPVAVITGDGSLGFYLAEIDTAVRHKLPLILIVGNDAGWGLERELQAATVTGSPNVACELAPTRYDVITQGFGGDGETVERLDQVAPAVARALASKVPYCLNVRIQGVRSPFTDWQILGKR
ncbi:MAG: thiamine pyrophosphate-binding protein [Bryobacteraceae bacterium]|nr:thiamine pyrophosphate-binding protein [Bryobacteraceae bacterium]